MRRFFIVAAALVILAITVVLITFTQKKEVKKPSVPPDPWKIVSYAPEGGYGTFLGNGSIGVRLRNEGIGWKEEPLQCLMAGMYEGESLAPLPNFSDFPIYSGDTVQDDKRFIIDPKKPYEQTLDMKSGVLTTKCTLRNGRKLLPVEIKFAVSRHTDRVDIIVKAEPRFSGPITVRNCLSAARTPWKVLESKLGKNHAHLLIGMTDQPERVSITSLISGKFSEIRSNLSSPNESEAISDLTFTVEKGEPLELTKTVIISRGVKSVETHLKAAADESPEKALDNSRKAWGKLWRSCIEIEGDPEAQQAVNSCLFYLLQSVRENTDYSIPPTGLSNNAWNGHVFWDADTWMFPALLAQYPELAKSIVAYRFKTLPGAKQNAKNRGLDGAEFAWESARTGLETIGMPFKEERHITSDVAFAQWQYYLATQDKEWLRNYGYPVISASADYWVSRVEYNSAQDRYEILNIMPPDEDAEIVNNNAYTNAGAKKVLEIASEAAKLLGKNASPKWKEIARKMYIPYDKKNDRFIEFDGFDREMSKQADTELLIYPLEHPMADSTRINTFDYWAKKVNPKGPAMSSSVHAVIAARLGRADEAYDYFTESYKPFFRPPFNFFNEKRSEMYENMCFMTGAAGPVQAVIYGFCGLRYGDDGQLTLKPNLPKKWKSVVLRNVHTSGKRFDITIRAGQEPEFHEL